MARPDAGQSTLQSPKPTGGNPALPDSPQPAFPETDEPHAQGHQAPEITYDEQFYPARPKRFRPSARRLLNRRERRSGGDESLTDNRAYVEWLVEESMLTDANRLATQLSGQGSMWQNPFAHPDPRAALE